MSSETEGRPDGPEGRSAPAAAAADEQPGAGAAERPAAFRDARFVIEEGLPYRVLRTGAIWMNKLFFSAVVLLALWLLLAALGQVAYGCADVPDAGPSPDGGGDVTCSAWLSPTAKYLGAMALVSFGLSIAFGLLGLVVGKNVIQATRAADEVGARDPNGTDAGAEDRGDAGEARGDGGP